MANNCNNCNSAKEMMELKDMPSIPFAAHEAEVGRQDRQIKRMWIALIVAIGVMFFTNMAWIGAWTSYDYSSEEYIYTQDGEGTNIIGDSNNVNGSENNNSEEEAD